jgi:glycosyltransferase involved in cell wall biosynthesis
VAGQRISVALVTRNRPPSLERTLRSLRAQSRQPFEVLVSDDSDPEHAAGTRTVAEAHGCAYRRGPGRGLYANRNAAALACAGTHVRSMDDDHEFPPGHWQRCEDAVEGDDRSVWIIGEVIPSIPTMTPDACPGELHPRGFSVSPPDPDDTWAIADGASIYPADLFRRGILFSERFRFGASYLEFGSRLHWLGQRIRYLPGTYVIHHHDVANRSFDDRDEDLAARVFATVSHSFVYRPSLRNRALTSAQIAREVAARGPAGVAATRRGLRAVRAQQRLTGERPQRVR